MNLKQIIAATQERWLAKIKYGRTPDSCPLCKYADWKCAQCPVVHVFEQPCDYLRSYARYLTIEYAGTVLSQRRASCQVLEDINKIARHYHLKQVEIPNLAKKGKRNG